MTVSMEPAEVQRTVERMQNHIRRMAALPGSGVRADQVLAIAQAFEKLINDGDRGGTHQSTASSAAPANKP